MKTIDLWAKRHNISPLALAELKATLIGDPLPSAPTHRGKDVHSEGAVQNLVRLEAARKGVRLWRNNVGVLMDATGRPVRFGLANDSKQLNDQLKSGDLIGWRQVIITQEMVGTVIAQFVSREVKEAGWHYTGSGREAAQKRWIDMIVADGGDAAFTAGEETL